MRITIVTGQEDYIAGFEVRLSLFIDRIKDEQPPRPKPPSPLFTDADLEAAKEGKASYEKLRASQDAALAAFLERKRAERSEKRKKKAKALAKAA